MCTIEAELPEWQVTVSPEGAAPFDVVVRGSRGRIDVGAGPRLAVEWPLRIDASIPEVSLAPAVEGWLSEVLFATPRTRLVPIADRGAEVELRVDLGGVSLDPVVLPCDALAFGDLARREVPAASRPTTIALQARPGGGPTYEMRLAHADEIVMFDELQRSGERVQVEREWEDGTIVRGWIEASMKGFPRSWLSGSGGSGPRCSRAQFREDSLVLRSGATIHAAPGGPAWATAATEIRAHRYRQAWGELDPAEDGTWIRLDQVEGVAEPPDGCAPLAHAWVRVADLAAPLP